MEEKLKATAYVVELIKKNESEISHDFFRNMMSQSHNRNYKDSGSRDS